MQILWHRPPDGPATETTKDHIMFLRFETAQRIAVSLVGAIVFAAVAVSAATPILPVA